MSGRSLNLDVLVTLKDRLSSGLSRLKRSLQGIADVARKIGVVGTAIAAISFMGPIQEAAAFQQKLIDISLTQSKTGTAVTAAVSKMKAQYEELALATGNLSDTIAAGAGQMIAAGLDEALVDASIGTVARAAKAANAEFSDMAALSTSLVQTLKVAPRDLPDALGALVVAGKLGSFELKDMAQYFPQLTSQMAKFGITGRRAIDFLAPALQIAKKGASDPSVAANNLNNFLSKVLAPITVKNFQEMGVDIEAVMKDAATKGINPIEAVLQKVVKLTGTSDKEISGFMAKAKARGLEGADALAYVREQLESIGAAGKIAELFGDQQVLDFLVPMMGNIAEFKQIQAEVAAATGAAIDPDFDAQMAGLNTQLTIFREIGTQAAREVGLAFGQWLPGMNARMAGLLKFLRELDAATGGWVKTGLVAAGGGLLFAGALGAIGLALPLVGAGLSVLAALFSPIGLAIAALAAGAVLVARNWDRIGPRLGALWRRMRTGFSDFVDGVRTRGQRLVASGRELVARYGPAITAGLGRAWQTVGDIARQVAGRLPSFDQLRGAALQTFERIMTRLVAIKDDVVGFFSGFSSAFGEAFANSSQGEAGTAIISALATAFERLKAVAAGGFERIGAVFDVVGRFISGFAGEGAALGSAFGTVAGEISNTIAEIAGIVDNVGKIGARISEGIGIDWTALIGDGAETLGKLFGQTMTRSVDLVGKFAGAINSVLSSIRELTGFLARGEPIDWAKIIPQGVIEGYNNVMQAIDNFMSKVNAFFAWVRGLVAPSIPMPTLGGMVAPGLATEGAAPTGPSLRKYLPPDHPNHPANTNTPPERRSDAGGTRFSALETSPTQAALQRVAVTSERNTTVVGDIRVKVDGPGTVTRSAFSASSDRGRAVGRA